jgi:ketosteroid isomerase-like protein
MPEDPSVPGLEERTRSSFAAASNRDWDAVMAFFAQEAVWQVSELQAFEGQRAIRGFLEDWVGTYEDADIEVEDVLDLGGGVAFVIATLDGRLAGSTAHMRVRFGAAYRWAGELITQIASSGDIEQARAVAEGLAAERA